MSFDSSKQLRVRPLFHRCCSSAATSSNTQSFEGVCLTTVILASGAGYPGSVLPGLTPFPVQTVQTLQTVQTVQSSSELLEGQKVSTVLRFRHILPENGGHFFGKVLGSPGMSQGALRAPQRNPRASQKDPQGHPKGAQGIIMAHHGSSWIIFMDHHGSL